MTGAGNQEDAETVGLGESIIIVAQPWPEFPAQMEGFLDLNFWWCAGKKRKSPNAGVRMRW